MKILTLICVLFLQASYVPSEGARILVVFPTPTQSHYSLGIAFVKELASKNHNVTFITAFESNLGENVTDIVITEFRKPHHEEGIKNIILKMNDITIFHGFYDVIQWSKLVVQETFKTAAVQDLLNSTSKFDLVIMEGFLSDGYAGFAHRFDCPLIVFSSFGANIWINHIVANQEWPSFIPTMLTDFTTNMNFWTRTKNYFINIIMAILHRGIHRPNQEHLLQEYFPGAPTLREIINKKLTVLFLNSHPTINYATPLVPNMIEIGGYHISKPKPLPKDLQNYLDKAKEGFIYFSMGSVVKSIMLPLETRQIILRVLAQLPYKILWKYEDNQITDLPSNVKIAKWFPQNDILAHPNIKLFITHGGLLSRTEAVFHGVPVMGIPVFGDQALNMAGAEALGMGKFIPFNEITYEKLLRTLRELLENKSYSANVKRRSALFRDQPFHPLDSAMYWIDYSLKHKNADHLKTGAIHLAWYQIRSLDVIIFMGTVSFGIIFLFFFALKKYRQKNQKNILLHNGKKEK